MKRLVDKLAAGETLASDIAIPATATPSVAKLRKSSLVSSLALAMALTACGGGGGGGGGGIVSTPPPVPNPASFPAIVTTATTTQQFAVKGASYTTPLVSYSNLPVVSPSLADGGQMDVRYNAASNIYEIQLPNDVAWQPISGQARYAPPNDNVYLYRAGPPEDAGVVDHRSNLQYSALLEWFTDTRFGYSAIGIATLPGNVPVTGSASYSGSLVGASSETRYDPWEAAWVPRSIQGNINLSFNFGSGTFSGNINPSVGSVALPSLNFANTIYSTGATNFSGMFATPLPGQNSFSGLFTGPSAQELIGNFAFPYVSPTGGTTEQAAGAFAGRRP